MQRFVFLPLDVFGMNTVNGVPHLLPGGDQEREPHASLHSQCAMLSEDAGVLSLSEDTGVDQKMLESI